MSDYLIFVDFDGVLTSARVHVTQPDDSYPIWSTFDPVVMEFFNKIHHTYDVKFVWTTTWRNHMPDNVGSIRHIIYSMWYNAGFRGQFADPWSVNTPTIDNHKRAEEIKFYLEDKAFGCKDYIVIDDSDYGFNDVLDKKRFVKTDPHNGMLFEHMMQIKSIIGQWKKK